METDHDQDHYACNFAIGLAVGARGGARSSDDLAAGLRLRQQIPDPEPGQQFVLERECRAALQPA